MNNELDELNELDPQTPAATDDEKKALRSLDDTTIRPLPEVSAIWEPLDSPAPAPATDSGTSTRARTIALVVAVAVVSFVAGGFTARLSSQMPVLFAQHSEPTESTASFEKRYAPANPVEETVEQEQTDAPAEPSYDTSYDTTDDSWLDKDDESDEPVKKDDEDDKGDDDGDGSYLRWYFDDEGDRSVTYDDTDRRVTLDYDDNTYSFTLEDLLNDDALKDQNEGETRYDPYEYETRRRYDSGTGYDSTDAERDSYGWRGWGTYGGYDYHT